ncbi:MAG TPA: TonB-dependent receptor, partial [Bacteroidetes bacterium]|nr:TonB-dependent receptor [Bacteroidota bacterium]
MKGLIIYIIAIVLFSNSFLVSQKLINGYVKSEISGESLINAYVEINSKSTKIIRKTITNEYGFYKISIPSGSYIMTVSYVGYNSKNILLDILNDTTVNVNLKSQQLNNVVIYDNSSSNILQERIELGHINFDIEKIKTIPSLTGEPDILKVLSLAPGINLGVEGSSSLFVRGGTPDQNYILLDEAPVYNPAHLFGFISVFNGDALKNVDIWKSSFPARYGGRLSSIIDIKMREGNRKKRKIKYRLGLLSSSAVIEGPISKRISYIVSGRTSYFDVFTFPLKIQYNSGKRSNYFNYRMYDLNAKMNYKISPRSKFFISYYHGGDMIVNRQKFSNTEDISDFKWINSTVTSRFFRQLGKSMFFNAIFYFSEYKQNYLFIDKIDLPQNNEYNNRLDNNLSINEFGAKLNFESLLFENHYLKYGGSIIRRFYRPIDMNITFADSSNINKKLEYKNSEFASFVEDEFKLSNRLSSNIGIRFSGLRLSEKYNWDIEPRISIKYDLENNYALKLSFSKMKQYINWSKPFVGSLPFDIWLPSTKNLPPQRAFHYNLGLNKKIKQQNIDIS